MGRTPRSADGAHRWPVGDATGSRVTGFHHETVLLREAVEALAPRPGRVFVDATLGGGGHAEALLSSADCRVIGLDRDPEALAAARDRLSSFGDRFVGVHSSFDCLTGVLAERSLGLVDGVLADLGVSSHQLDTPRRGFSFRRAGPVDMRMNPNEGLTADAWIAQVDEEELVWVLRSYGDVPRAHRVARVLKEGQPWSDTVALAEAVAAVQPRTHKTHPATRVFMALRMAVNDELGQLERFLDAALDALAVGGRLAVITFHSVEDRAVKHWMANQAGKNLPRDAWGHRVGDVRVSVFKPQVPHGDANRRARSSRLRVAQRCA